MLWVTPAYSGRFLYLTNSESNSLSVIDADKGRVVIRIPTGLEPFGLAFVPQLHRVYVANAQSADLTVISTLGWRVIDRIPLKSSLPVWTAPSPDGSYLYVSNEGSHEVAVISTASHRVVAKIPVGRGPAGIAVSQDGRFGFVANEGTHDVSILDLRLERVLESVPVGSVPQGVALGPSDRELYVANFGSDSVSIICSATRKMVAEIPLNSRRDRLGRHGPVGLAISPDGARLYTGNFNSGSLSIIDVARRRSLRNVPLAPGIFAVAVPASGQPIYAVSGKGKTVFAVDPDKAEIVQQVEVGQGAFQLAIQPDLGVQLKTVHGWLLLYLAGVAGLALLATRPAMLSPQKVRLVLAGIVALGLLLRVVGLDWGIPVYDQETLRAEPELRVSFHMDEDDFLWNLTRVRPEALDFYVADFHWGTLQYYLIESVFLFSEAVGWLNSPWRVSFLEFDPAAYGRLFVLARSVSALLGSATLLMVFGVGSKLFGKQVGLLSALTLAILPLHVLNSHYLTPDISMTFFLTLTFYGLVSSFERPGLPLSIGTGIAFGLAVAAKYNAAFFLPVILLAHGLQRQTSWPRKLATYPGIAVGFLIGVPYALSHWAEFSSSLEKYLLATLHLPGTAVPGAAELMGLQLNSMAFFALGLPLTVGCMLCGVDRLAWRFHGPDSNSPCLPRTGNLSARYKWLLVGGSLACFILSLWLIRHPLIRYTLPALVFLVYPIGYGFYQLTRQRWARPVICLALVGTGFLSFLQVEVLTQEHPANRAFRWIERHLPPGTQLVKGWPGLPVLNSKKYQVTNYYTQERLVDFKDFFLDEDGRPFSPGYVLLDNLPTFSFPPGFLRQLNRNYALVAEFNANFGVWALALPSRFAPHDWKYSHPEIRIYRRVES